MIQEPVDGPARSVLVWLHGLGATADDFVDLGRQLQCPGLRVIVPQAPQKAVTIFGGDVTPSWFDLLPQPDGGITSDLGGLEESARQIQAELNGQREAGIDRLAVGGFSQGGALALFTALTHFQPLAATVCLSGYLPQHEYMTREADRLVWQAPVFMAHGSEDGVVPCEYGEMTRDWLREHGTSVNWHSAAFAHTVTSEELTALGVFLRTHLG